MNRDGYLLAQFAGLPIARWTRVAPSREVIVA